MIKATVDVSKTIALIAVYSAFLGCSSVVNLVKEGQERRQPVPSQDVAPEPSDMDSEPQPKPRQLVSQSALPLAPESLPDETSVPENTQLMSGEAEKADVVSEKIITDLENSELAEGSGQKIADEPIGEVASDDMEVELRHKMGPLDSQGGHSASESVSPPSQNSTGSVAVAEEGWTLPHEDRAIEAEKALGWLKNGNVRFRKGHLRADGQSPADRVRLVNFAQPHSLIVTCGDSRIPPELIFDQKLGEIHVLRTNSSEVRGSLIESLDYALKEIGVRNIVVLGSVECPGVLAAPDRVAQSLLRKSQFLKLARQQGLLISPATYELGSGEVRFKASL